MYVVIARWRWCDKSVEVVRQERHRFPRGIPRTRRCGDVASAQHRRAPPAPAAGEQAVHGEGVRVLAARTSVSSATAILVMPSLCGATTTLPTLRYPHRSGRPRRLPRHCIPLSAASPLVGLGSRQDPVRALAGCVRAPSPKLGPPKHRTDSAPPSASHPLAHGFAAHADSRSAPPQHHQTTPRILSSHLATHDPYDRTLLATI